jgi:hypothetical protein
VSLKKLVSKLGLYNRLVRVRGGITQFAPPNGISLLSSSEVSLIFDPNKLPESLKTQIDLSLENVIVVAMPELTFFLKAMLL